MKFTKSTIFHRLYVAVMVVICIGILLSIAMFNFVRNEEYRNIQSDFNLAALNRVNLIQKEIEKNIEVLRSLYRLYKSSEFVTREGFLTFCKSSILHHNDIQALEWVPRIPHSQRRDYERNAQIDGYPGFRITKREEQGKMVSVDENEEYFPVYYLEPYKGNELALGFDVSTNPVSLEALNKARDTGEMIATGRITLVQEPGSQYGFLAFVPVYRNDVITDTIEKRRENLIGFTLGVFRIRDIAVQSLAYLEATSIDIHIFDKSSSQEEQFLYTHISRFRRDIDQTITQQGAKGNDGMYASHTFHVADRKWEVRCTALPEFIEQRRTWFPLMFLYGGLLITGLLSVYLWSRISKTIQAEEFVSKLTLEIHERKRAEESMAGFAYIIEESLNEIYIFDAKTLRFIQVNKGARLNLGYSLEELSCLTPLDLKPELTPESFMKIIEPLRVGKNKKIEFTAVHQRKDGSLYDVEVHLQLSSFQSVPVFVAIILDITERKKMEGALIQSEKLKSIGTITAGISHEFNNILAVISGKTQLLKMDYEDNDKLIDELSIIDKAADDGAEISSNMLKFTKTRPDTKEYVTFDIRELIEQSIEFTMPRWMNMAQAKGINYLIDKKGMKKAPSIMCNLTEIREVFINIINNALDAMPDGGSISFCTWSKDDTLFISISDTGKGMTKEVKYHIFDPFFTTRCPEGTGLGMSMAYGIITRHGGKIEVESDLGKGSTFTLQFPTTNKKISPTVTPEPEQEINKKNLRILVVDDKEDFYHILDQFLSRKGHNVKTVDNGADAINIIKAEDFDLVLSDLGMPDVNGYELAKAINKLKRRPKIGIITGWTLDLKRFDEEERKVDFILTKPFKNLELTRHINELFGADSK
ncbi:MAG: response regulator [Candidatus Scalindua sp.]|jgi:PAS domain S-box-containing protein|nr:response regulator [Candidatus Scalindua sp.]MBT6563618.1 response regulator [Candidatus Scalindua sp.]MBT7213377.1 response regulator [Candidatus Scalindua sp.]